MYCIGSNPLLPIFLLYHSQMIYLEYIYITKSSYFLSQAYLLFQAITPVPSVTKGPRCVARFDFEGENPHDLHFKAGDTIELQEHIGTDWLKGKLFDKEGIFPVTFVETIEDITLPVQSKWIEGYTGTFVVCVVPWFWLL